MPYINTQTLQYPMSEIDIRLAFPDIAFPQQFIPPEPYALVFPSPIPVYDAITEGYREIEPILTSKGHWEQQWEVVDLPSEQIAANQEAKAAAELIAKKAARQQEVDNLKITISSGKEFDGDEISQSRMTRAIMAGQITNIQSCTWVLVDNTPTEVTLAELQEALSLAIQAQGAIWAKPYEE